MSIFHFYEEIKRGLKENYFLYSEQAFMLQEAYSVFQDHLKEKGEVLNSQVLDISERPPLSLIIETLTTPGFFGNKGWTIVKNAHLLKLEDFKSIAPEIGDSKILFLYNKESPEKIMDIMKEIKFLSVSLRDHEVRHWIEYKAKSMGLKLSEELIQYIEEITEGNPAIAAAELQKIAISGIEKPSLAELKELIYGHSEYDAWDLIEAIKRKDRARALLILRALRTSKKDDLIMVIGALNKFYSGTKDYDTALPILHEMDILSKTNREFLEHLLLRLPGL
ncbi:MAG: hypothetical protein N2257_06380 [Thermodesulfovibrionales bacterium]|nr:hypothetical protein [Thermodesulfovibrionales bacterium]